MYPRERRPPAPQAGQQQTSHQQQQQHMTGGQSLQGHHQLLQQHHRSPHGQHHQQQQQALTTLQAHHYNEQSLVAALSYFPSHISNYPLNPQTAIPDKYPNIQYSLVAGKPYGEGSPICIPLQYSLLSLLMLRKPGFAAALRPSHSKLILIVPQVDSAVFLHFLEWVYTGEYGPQEYRMPRVPRHPLPNQTIVDGPQQFYDSPLNPWKHPMLCSHIDRQIVEMYKNDNAWLALNISLAILSETWGLEKSHYPRSTSPAATDGSVTIPDDISLAQLAKYKLAMQPVTLRTWVEVYIPTVYPLVGARDSCLRVYTRQYLDVEERLEMRARIERAWEDGECRGMMEFFMGKWPGLKEDVALLFRETNEFPGMSMPEGLVV